MKWELRWDVLRCEVMIMKWQMRNDMRYVEMWNEMWDEMKCAMSWNELAWDEMKWNATWKKRRCDDGYDKKICIKTKDHNLYNDGKTLP